MGEFVTDRNTSPPPVRPRYAYWPSVRRNPVLSLLYMQAEGAGYDLMPLAADGLYGANLSHGDILHLHWVHHALAGAKTRLGARRRRKVFIRHLKALQGQGVRLVWTVHNRLSHDARFEGQEVKLRAELAALVDAVHILNPDTADAVSGLYPFAPRRVFYCPHPAYAGVYPASENRAALRRSLGVAPDEKLLLTFGAVQRRKGIHRLVHQIDALSARVPQPVRLIIAGQCAQKKFRHTLAVLTDSDPRIDWQQRYLSDADLGALITASDVVVCPYRHALNSGVAVAGASLGRPIVIPRQLAPVFDARVAAEHFDANSDADLVDALVRALARRAEDPSRLAWADDHAPGLISARFFAALEAALSSA